MAKRNCLTAKGNLTNVRSKRANVEFLSAGTVNGVYMAKPTKPSRKALFRAALALNEMTAQEWASREGVTGSAVSLAVNGYRNTGEVVEKIDRFIAKHMGKHETALAS